MLGRFHLSIVHLLLLSVAVTAVPGDPPPKNLYRADGRSISEVRSKGLGTRAETRVPPSRPDQMPSLKSHVENGMNPHSNFLSTTTSHDFAMKHNKNGKIYHIDSSRPTGGQYHSVAEMYKNQGKTYGHKDEKEYAHEGGIPSSAITRVDTVRNHKVVKSQSARELGISGIPKMPKSWTPKAQPPGRPASRIPLPKGGSNRRAG